MGVDLADVVREQSITLEQLSGKILAIDAYNALYQFLAIIRQPDGTPLKDHQGKITSHLSGILYRTANLTEKGIKVTFVFDGKPPELKQREIIKRRQVKLVAKARYEQAIQEGRIEDARTYAQATSQVKDTMIADAKTLLDAMGVSWIQAPSEGEAQAAYMAARGDVWAVASQDHDSLLFGTPRMLKNLAITGRRKLPRRNVYVEVEPKLIELPIILREMSLTKEQLVDVGILIGTDFNPDGIRGVGPKTALRLIQENGSIEKVIERDPKIELSYDYNSIRRIFLHPDVTSDYSLKWSKPNQEKVIHFLCKERDFSEERVRKVISKMMSNSASKTLESYFS